VDARPRRIKNYKQADGREPYAIWFESIRRLPAGRKVAVRIDRAEDGNLGDHRFLGGGFGELRIDFGDGYRVYFGEDGDILVLLLGGTKSTQDRDIAIARVFWSDYNA